MSQRFSFKLNEKDVNKAEQEAIEKSENHLTESHVRNLCFVWPDGKKKFLNYAYLVSGEYLPEENSIKLAFTSETILIKGDRLEGLFEQLLNHEPKRIVCTDERYAAIDDSGIFVTEILIGKSDQA